MGTVVTVIHCITCVLLVLVVLIQSGKGAEISASFGGSSQTVFGSSGGANFFTRFTATAAAIFMVTSLVLTIIGSRNSKSMFEGMPQPNAAQQAPLTPPAGAAQAPAPAAPPAATTQQEAPKAAEPAKKDAAPAAPAKKQ